MDGLSRSQVRDTHPRYVPELQEVKGQSWTAGQMKDTKVRWRHLHGCPVTLLRTSYSGPGLPAVWRHPSHPPGRSCQCVPIYISWASNQQALPGLYSQAAGAHPSRSAASPCHAEPSSRREPLPRGVVGLVSASSNQRPSPAGRRIGRSGWIITTTEFPRSVVQTTVDGVPGGLEESVVGRRRTNSAALGYPPLPFVRSSQTSVRHPACSRFAVVVVALRGLVLRGSGGCLRTPFPS